MKKSKIIRREVVYNRTQAILKYGASVYYEGIDFLSFKIPETSDIFMRLISDQVVSQVDGGFELLPGLGVLYKGMIKGNRVHLFEIKTENLVTVGFIRCVVDRSTQNYVLHSDIELTSFFFMGYSRHLETIFSLFCVDKALNRTVTRIDYCMDISGVDSHYLSSLVSWKNAVSKVVDDRTTYKINQTERNEICIYDKKLEIIDNKKFQDKYNGVYKHYIEKEYPISRIECRKKSRSLRELPDSSLNACFAQIKTLFSDYVFEILSFSVQLISSFVPVRSSGSIKDEGYKKHFDLFCSRVLHKKSVRNRQMLFAYAKNISSLESQNNLFNLLYEQYGDSLLVHGFKQLTGHHIPVHTYLINDLQEIFDTDKKECFNMCTVA